MYKCYDYRAAALCDNLKSLFYILSTRPKSPLIVCQCIHSIRLPVLFTYFADIIVLFVVALFRLLITSESGSEMWMSIGVYERERAYILILVIQFFTLIIFILWI